MQRITEYPDASEGYDAFRTCRLQRQREIMKFTLAGAKDTNKISDHIGLAEGIGDTHFFHDTDDGLRLVHMVTLILDAVDGMVGHDRVDPDCDGKVSDFGASE